MEHHKNIKKISSLYQWCFSFTNNSSGHALFFIEFKKNKRFAFNYDHTNNSGYSKKFLLSSIFAKYIDSDDIICLCVFKPPFLID